MERAEKAHKELRDYFSKIDKTKTVSQSSTNSASDDYNAFSNEDFRKENVEEPL
jgi:hypothetical protein